MYTILKLPAELTPTSKKKSDHTGEANLSYKYIEKVRLDVTSNL